MKIIYYVDYLKKQNCGCKCKDYGEKLEKDKRIPLCRRGTIKSVAYTFEVSKCALVQILKNEKSVKRDSSIVKPFRTEKDKKDHIKFVCKKYFLSGNEWILM
ncbi:hypothetical protein NPIL_599271 [Nephila pilipes]|uniref:Uncharacterized protein n=1 Tax=Nephila pilipes TaxID=299642 RepID=A0A8X6NDP1_NEPPI|nr:hypothetical protein NPIL_599271 [Nephila pilipes]